MNFLPIMASVHGHTFLPTLGFQLRSVPFQIQNFLKHLVRGTDHFAISGEVSLSLHQIDEFVGNVRRRRLNRFRGNSPPSTCLRGTDGCLSGKSTLSKSILTCFEKTFRILKFG